MKHLKAGKYGIKCLDLQILVQHKLNNCYIRCTSTRYKEESICAFDVCVLTFFYVWLQYK